MTEQGRDEVLCASLACQHARSHHGDEGCTVPLLDYSERRFTADGDRLPPRERPCGCPWMEPFDPPRSLPREVIEEAGFARQSAAGGAS